jgi:iron complex outermembrane receptor protein
MRGVFMLVAAGAFALLAIPDPSAVYAAESADAGPDALEQIVVVAQRREELAQTVPLSITAITAVELQNNTIQSGLDLQKMVPSLSVIQGTQASSASYSLRGIRNGVLTYLDETPTLSTEAGAVAVDYQLFDLQSVQAISGPQGTLFGRNSTGGAILFVPQKPTKDWEGSLEVGYGNYGRWEGTGYINIPVNDMLQLRIGGQEIHRQAVVTNLAGPGEQSQGRSSFRAAMMFTPTDWLHNYLLVDGGNTDETPFAPISKGYVGGACPAALFACFYGKIPVQQQALQDALGNRTVSQPYPEYQRGQERGVEDVLTADLGPYTLKYIFGYRTSNVHQLGNQISMAIPAIFGQGLNNSDQRTHELQLSGTALGNTFRWVGGLFYRNNHSQNDNADLVLAPLGTVITDPFDLSTAYVSPVQQRNISKAGYAQGTYNFTDALGLTLGARYTQDDQHSIAEAYAPKFTCILNPAIPGVNLATCQQPQYARFHAITYNASMDYKLTNGIFLYATTRRGYNPGGFNQGVDPSLAAYTPEYLKDYEIGIKADWRIAGIPVRTNVSGFYGKYTDIQRTGNRLIETSTGLRPFSGIFNAASATIYGSQFDFQVRPVEWLTLSGNYGYLHTKYDQFSNDITGNATGNAFAQAPEQTANFGINVTQPMSFATFDGNVGYAYLSKVTFADANLGRGIAFQGGYGLVDARMALKNIVGSGFDVAIWGKNLTNKLYNVNISDEPVFGFTTDIFGDPRTYGVEVRYSFGPRK